MKGCSCKIIFLKPETLDFLDHPYPTVAFIHAALASPEQLIPVLDGLPTKLEKIKFEAILICVICLRT